MAKFLWWKQDPQLDRIESKLDELLRQSGASPEQLARLRVAVERLKTDDARLERAKGDS